jgi:diacylglycerol kinase family enzyme
MSRSYVVVANRGAGSSDRAAVTAARDLLAAAGTTEVCETDSPRELDAVVAGLGPRTLVVAGGDGSLHAAVNALYRAGAAATTTVGLIPLGTGNDLARTVGIPRDPVAAASVVRDALAQEQDLLLGPDDQVAVNAVHLGVGAEAVRLGARAKARLGAPGFAVGALLAGVRYPGWQLTVEVDGHRMPEQGRALMVGLSLGRTIGGGAELAPDADPTDGLVDVTVASTTGPWRRLSFAYRLRGGRHVALSDVATAKGTRITVSGDPVRANVDGEVSQPRRDWQWTVLRRGWRLLVP